MWRAVNPRSYSIPGLGLHLALEWSLLFNGCVAALKVQVPYSARSASGTGVEPTLQRVCDMLVLAMFHTRAGSASGTGVEPPFQRVCDMLFLAMLHTRAGSASGIGVEPPFQQVCGMLNCQCSIPSGL